MPCEAYVAMFNPKFNSRNDTTGIKFQQRASRVAPAPVLTKALPNGHLRNGFGIKEVWRSRQSHFPNGRIEP